MACAWAMGFVPPISVKYAENGVTMVANQLRYLCCLNQFQKELNEEEGGLTRLQQDLELKLEKERKNNRIPNKVVENWTESTKEALNKVLLLQTAIEEDQRCLNNTCPNWIWRYNRSKEAKQLTETLRNLKEAHEKLPQSLAHEVDVPSIEFVQYDGFISSRASKLALDEIMTALETEGVNIIGLHGMPGVGKTTLAKQVRKEALKKELFKEFLMVTFSEKPDYPRIQKQLAEQLHLWLGRGSSMEERASSLMLRLLDGEKKLLVLDDIWGELNLSDIGIPPFHHLKNCKILLTTRRIPVCDTMKCQQKIVLDILTHDEAWYLFKNTVNLNSSLLEDVAKEVAKECGGLPLAILSVGNALRGKMEINAWEKALEKLRKGEIEHMRDINKENNAYISLKFSFDQLPREETKLCLMLCAFFPEDYAIFGHELASCAMHLGISQRFMADDDQEIRRGLYEEIDELKNSHLLLKSEILERAFTMHDLVRDVVLKIGRNYSLAGEFGTKEFKMESEELQRITSYFNFENDRFAVTINESSDVSVEDFIDSQELVLTKSAKSALLQIIEALKTDGVNMIGLHGLPRAGKTSWAKQVANGAVRAKLFDEFIYVSVMRTSAR